MIEMALLIMLIGFFFPTLLCKKIDFFYPSSFLALTFILPITMGSFYYLQLGAFGDNINTNMFFMACVSIMTICYVFSYIVFKNSSKNICTSILDVLDVDLSEISKRINVCLLLLLCLYIIILFLLISYTGLNPISDPLWFRVKSSHDFGLLYANFQFIPIYLIIYAYYYKVLSVGFFSKCVHNFIIVVAVLLMFFSGARGMVAQAILSVLVLRKIFERKELTWGKVVFFSCIGAVFFIWYQAYRITDSLGLLEFWGILSDISLNNTMLWEVVLRYDVLLNFHKILIEFANGNIPMMYGQSLFNALLMFIPRALYADKPLMTNIELHKHFSTQDVAGALDFNSGYMMAEAFLNFHVVGIALYAALWGMFMASLDSKYQRSLNNNKRSIGFFIFYLPIMLCTSFPQDGFNSMFFQQIIIAFAIAIMQVFILKVKIVFKRKEPK